jgi:acyl-CoA thioester hydrolase
MLPKPTPDSRSVYTVHVRFRDTDLMGIVHHAVYLEYFEAARIEYLRRRGAEYVDWTKQGIHLAVAEAHTQYRRPATFGDTLAVEATLVELTGATARFEYRLVRSAPDRELVAEGWTLLVCVGNDNRPRRIPEELAAPLCGPETHPLSPDRQ